MKTISKRACQIGLFVFGLAAVPATTHAQPFCLYNSETGVISVLQVGQAGAPATPLLIGGYELFYHGGDLEWKQLPIVGNLNINPASITLGWTTHFDFNSGDWKCPAGDTMLKVSEEGIAMDVTYHGTTDDDPLCPVSSVDVPEPFACPAGIFPFDPDAIVLGAGAAPKGNGR